MPKAKISKDPLYQLLRQEKVSDFNQYKTNGNKVDLRGCDFRGLDLRNLDADGLDFTDCYFRAADLRGVDFRNSVLEGASLSNANVSGCYFPKELSAEEIRLSVTNGTRMRYR